MAETRETVRDMLRPLIAQARSEGKWLRCAYQNLWFSPDELDAKNSEGLFCWGPVNWELLDPCVREAQLLRDVADAEKSLSHFRRRAGFAGHE